jgi:hypothetical protein
MAVTTGWVSVTKKAKRGQGFFLQALPLVEPVGVPVVADDRRVVELDVSADFADDCAGGTAAEGGAGAGGGAEAGAGSEAGAEAGGGAGTGARR